LIYCLFQYSSFILEKFSPKVTLIRDQVWINVDAFNPMSLYCNFGTKNKLIAKQSDRGGASAK